jgi:type I restriction-modification system DNA methylase subunit
VASSGLVIGLLIFLSDTYPFYKKVFFQKRSILDKHFSNAQNQKLNNEEIARLVGSIDSEFLEAVGNYKKDIIVDIYKFMLRELNSHL